MLAIIRQATQGDTVITNEALPFPHTRYIYAQKDKKGKSAGALWGGASTNKTHMIDTNDYPFNWMLPAAKPAGLITALAKDSDRMLLMFPKNADIPPIYIFLAAIHNNTIRIYQGNKRLQVEISDIINEHVKQQYNNLILPALDPLPIPKHYYRHQTVQHFDHINSRW